jgi:hypothetical protein
MLFASKIKTLALVRSKWLEAFICYMIWQTLFSVEERRNPQ